MLGPVAGRVDDTDADARRRRYVAVDHRVELELRLGERMDRDPRAVLEREPAVAGDMVRVRVRLEDADDPDLVPLGFIDVLLDRVRRVDDDGFARGLGADQVRSAAEIWSRNWRKSTARVLPGTGASELSLKCSGDLSTSAALIIMRQEARARRVPSRTGVRHRTLAAPTVSDTGADADDQAAASSSWCSTNSRSAARARRGSRWNR